MQRAVAVVAGREDRLERADLELRAVFRLALVLPHGLGRLDHLRLHPLAVDDGLEPHGSPELRAAADRHELLARDGGRIGPGLECEIAGIGLDLDLGGQAGAVEREAMLERGEGLGFGLRAGVVERRERIPDLVFEADPRALPAVLFVGEGGLVFLADDPLACVEEEQVGLVRLAVDQLRQTEEERREVAGERGPLLRHDVFVFVVLHDRELGLDRPLHLLTGAVDAAIDDGRHPLRVGGKLECELKILPRGPQALDHVHAAGAEAHVPYFTAVHRMKPREPGAEQRLRRLAGAADVKPEHVAVAARAWKRLAEPQLLELTGPQFDQAAGDLGAVVARIDRPLGALHEKAHPHRLGAGVVILHREPHVDRVFHDGAELVDLERRGLGVEDQLGLRRVPDVRIEAVEEVAIAPHAADEPGAEHGAVGRRRGDRRLARGVVGVVERGER